MVHEPQISAETASKANPSVSTGAVSVYGAYFGQGTGRILIIRFCHGDEARLTECIIHDANNNTECSHQDDVGVICPGKYTLFH